MAPQTPASAMAFSSANPSHFATVARIASRSSAQPSSRIIRGTLVGKLGCR